ncbi:MAG: universal stress protein [Betaproteobacteria bacterium]
MRRILFASDFSPASRRAFATALRMARANRAKLSVLHVITPIAAIPTDPAAPVTLWQEIERSTRAWATGQVKRLVARARKAGVRAEGLLREGAPAETVVRTARSTRADLIVIGTHGRTGLSRMFVGSVAARVVATAPCPVVTVRGR